MDATRKTADATNEATITTSFGRRLDPWRGWKRKTEETRRQNGTRLLAGNKLSLRRTKRRASFFLAVAVFLARKKR